MIIDNIANAGSYTNLHPLFKQALDYINNTDLLAIETGKHPISEGLTAIISTRWEFLQQNLPLSLNAMTVLLTSSFASVAMKKLAGSREIPV
jgi:hypothetical protein